MRYVVTMLKMKLDNSGLESSKVDDNSVALINHMKERTTIVMIGHKVAGGL